MVEDFASWSSPERITTAPWVEVPAKLPCLSASPLRSTPGPLPYQIPVTPSHRLCGWSSSIWVPMCAVAACSSLPAGTKLTSWSVSRSGTRLSARS
ncbi:hypothetical protein [Blastococcus brunescens]|uniref:Uncharacterized protein n=1 Tax=Blastococcus brunescens TaxID=1564165 RepID=A0ABZ1AUL9_9ACTN|nr:hypothetical protein [Blastococcus sp. BMG 8361]WRL62276.1 hypothetical protein U6N30_19840 [Blastococcus sp. BMG 8361]